ncbi:phage tail terminator protein [Acinetobacter baumannii]|nr:hypothetical protein [Acinetobacter baumannii]
MNLLPLAKLLQTKQVGIAGQTIFVNMIPISAPKGVLLRNDLPGTEIDYELPGYFKTGFVVIVRDTSFDLAEQRMQRVSEVLTLNDTTVGDFHFNYCRPKTRPNAYPMSAGNLIELAAEYSVCGYEIKGE